MIGWRRNTAARAAMISVFLLGVATVVPVAAQQALDNSQPPVASSPVSAPVADQSGPRVRQGFQRVEPGFRDSTAASSATTMRKKDGMNTITVSTLVLVLLVVLIVLLVK